MVWFPPLAYPTSKWSDSSGGVAPPSYLTPKRSGSSGGVRNHTSGKAEAEILLLLYTPLTTQKRNCGSRTLPPGTQRRTGLTQRAQRAERQHAGSRMLLTNSPTFVA